MPVLMAVSSTTASVGFIQTAELFCDSTSLLLELPGDFWRGSYSSPRPYSAQLSDASQVCSPTSHHFVNTGWRDVLIVLGDWLEATTLRVHWCVSHFKNSFLAFSMQLSGLNMTCSQRSSVGGVVPSDSEPLRDATRFFRWWVLSYRSWYDASLSPQGPR